MHSQIPPRPSASPPAREPVRCPHLLRAFSPPPASQPAKPVQPFRHDGAPYQGQMRTQWATKNCGTAQRCCNCMHEGVFFFFVYLVAWPQGREITWLRQRYAWWVRYVGKQTGPFSQLKIKPAWRNWLARQTFTNKLVKWSECCEFESRRGRLDFLFSLFLSSASSFFLGVAYCFSFSTIARWWEIFARGIFQFLRMYRLLCSWVCWRILHHDRLRKERLQLSVCPAFWCWCCLSFVPSASSSIANVGLCLIELSKILRRWTELFRETRDQIRKPFHSHMHAWFIPCAVAKHSANDITLDMAPSIDYRTTSPPSPTSNDMLPCGSFAPTTSTYLSAVTACDNRDERNRQASHAPSSTSGIPLHAIGSQVFLGLMWVYGRHISNLNIALYGRNTSQFNSSISWTVCSCRRAAVRPEPPYFFFFFFATASAHSRSA